MKHVLIDNVDAPDFRLTFYDVKSLWDLLNDTCMLADQVF